MRKLFPFFTILLLSVITMNAQSKDEQAVANAVEQLHKAMVDADKTMLEKLTADQLSYGHSSGKVEDKNAFVTSIANGNSDFVSIDISEQTIGISGKTAIVRHIFRAITNDGGRPGEANIRILLIWQKQKGGWKLLARQAVKMT
jgi:ketosteroid isomerase-like protein